MSEDLAIRAARMLKERLLRDLPGRILDVRVFGSRARGDFHEESDLDVFVLVDQRDRATDNVIVDAAFDVTSDIHWAFPISPRIMSREQYDDLLRLERRIALDIQNEGIPV